MLRLRSVPSWISLLLLAFAAHAPAAPAAPLPADTPSRTIEGNTFIAPAGWTLNVRGPMTLLEPPEGRSALALVDVRAPDADAAVSAAWKAYKPDARWPLKVVTPAPPRDGWSDRMSYSYQTSPNEKRDVFADVRRANDVWTVSIYDMAQDVGEKRGAQVAAVFGKMLPKGYQRESFAGRKAHALDASRVAELVRFVETAMRLTKVPGVSVGLYQDGKVVFADGFGVREMGRSDRPDAGTRYMIASNTKAMATLMLARLVDQSDYPGRYFVPRRVADYSPNPGDLICASRGLSRPATFDGYTRPEALKGVNTHCDLVVRKSGQTLEVIGGNVRNSVSKSTLELDGAGRLRAMPRRPWFLILENRL